MKIIKSKIIQKITIIKKDCLRKLQRQKGPEYGCHKFASDTMKHGKFLCYVP